MASRWKNSSTRGVVAGGRDGFILLVGILKG